ncbi:MAG: capsid cement protein [Pseudohongiellaceae bacterium]
MSQRITLLALTFTASGLVSRHRAIGFDGAQATVQGQRVAGVAHFDAADGDDLTVGCAGTEIIETGAAIAITDTLIIDAEGRAIPSSGELSVDAGGTAVTSTAADGAILSGGDMPEYVFADPLETADGAGEFIEVLLRR